MAVVNFSVCLMLVLYRVSVVYSEASDTPDLALTDLKPESDSDGVRCYCNTAQCVSTGYMCRSVRGGGCYSELQAPRRHHASHGCLQHLADTTEEAVSRCQNSPSAYSRPPSRDSLLLCCFRDLCNHEDSPLAKARLNLTHDSEGNTIASDCGAGYNSEVWFKAATIAVPVCGAIILFLLVAVAVRLLKADALLHADRKLRGGYMSPLAQHNSEDVKKVWVGNSSAPLLMTPGGCLVAVERAQLVDMPCQPICDIQR
ncbi:BMP and activin membrane-bound inhibitor homolog [Choristoneura fumiferana]|uniref:BMP and activin membrane-bound inhibitor homolog n=1 Tax=Choristoneura fumiferana TaxID=7141 RepID=UPI003D15AA97